MIADLLESKLRTMGKQEKIAIIIANHLHYVGSFGFLCVCVCVLSVSNERQPKQESGAQVTNAFGRKSAMYGTCTDPTHIPECTLYSTYKKEKLRKKSLLYCAK